MNWPSKWTPEQWETYEECRPWLLVLALLLITIGFL